MRADGLAVAEHRELVGDLEQLVHLVRDVDDALALLAQLANDAEQMVDFDIAQRRRRLIHDEHLGVERHGLRDLDHLAACHRQRAHFGLRVDVDRQPGEQRLRAPAQFGVIDQAAAVPGLAPNPDVLGHGHVRHQVQFLMDHRNTAIERIERAVQHDRLALEADLAPVRRMHAGNDLHQRGLAGTVLAHQRMNGAAPHAQPHVVERDHAGKGFADATNFQQAVAGGRD